MMKVKLTPQYNPNQVIKYTFGADSFVAEIGGITDTFDFSKVNELNPRQIKTSLPVNPVVHVERMSGVLQLTLINYINEEATETERFPQFMEV